MTDKELAKFEKQQRFIVQKLCNKIKMAFSFKQITTWRELYVYTHGGNEQYINDNYKGPELTTAITKQDVDKWCEKLFADLDKEQAAKRAEPPSVPTAIIQEVITPSKAPSVTDTTVVTTQPTPIETTVANKARSEEESNYGLIPSPNEKAFLYWFQKKAIAEAMHKITVDRVSALLIIAGTGTGKTFIDAAIKRRLIDSGYHNGKSYGLSQYLTITRSTVVEQTKRVGEKKFNLKHPSDNEVINIEQLRSRAGAMWVKSEQKIINGEEVTEWKWHPMLNPVVIALDECQAVKNEDSTQHKIMCAFSSVPNTLQIYISATPFTRVSEAKAFCLATKMDISKYGFPSGTRLDASNWQTFAAIIAGGTAPHEYNEAAIGRLMDAIEPYTVRVKGVRWQFNAHNRVEVIPFQSEAARKEYADAWEKYLIKKARLEESVTDNPRFQAMIELMMFLTAAEYCKRDIFAERMYNNVQDGYASVLGVKNKKTVISVVKLLIEEYGVSRDDISIVWGGGQTALNAKQKAKLQLMNSPEALAALEASGISMEDLQLDEVEAKELEDLPKEWRLGVQSKEDRQREIDRFQSGKSRYAIFTYKAGGVGLSLHHCDELSPFKCRRKESGFAVEEDIPNVPIRQRKVTIGPTWSPIELIQAMGRVPRLTSLSDTDQEFLYYKGTVEEEQAHVVSHRLKCVRQVVRQNENWMTLLREPNKAKELVKELLDKPISEDNQDEGEIEYDNESED